MPMMAFRREWERANFGPHWNEQGEFFDAGFAAFIDAEVDGNPSQA
jgi:hypothetical protein